MKQTSRNAYWYGIASVLVFLLSARFFMYRNNPTPTPTQVSMNPNYQRQEESYIAPNPNKGSWFGLFNVGAPAAPVYPHPAVVQVQHPPVQQPGIAQQASDLANQQASQWANIGSQYAGNVVNTANQAASNVASSVVSGVAGGTRPTTTTVTSYFPNAGANVNPYIQSYLANNPNAQAQVQQVLAGIQNFNLNQFATGVPYFLLAYSNPNGQSFSTTCPNAQCQISTPFANSGTANNQGQGVAVRSFYLTTNYTDVNGNPSCPSEVAYAQPVQTSQGKIIPGRFLLVPGNINGNGQQSNQFLTILAVGAVQVPPPQQGIPSGQGQWTKPMYSWVLVSTGASYQQGQGLTAQPSLYLLSQNPQLPPNVANVLQQLNSQFPNRNIVPINSQCSAVYQQFIGLPQRRSWKDVATSTVSSIANPSYWQNIGQGIAQNAVNQVSGAAQSALNQGTGYIQTQIPGGNGVASTTVTNPNGVSTTTTSVKPPPTPPNNWNGYPQQSTTTTTTNVPNNVPVNVVYPTY